MGEEWQVNLEMDGQSAGMVKKRLEGSRKRLLDAPVLVLLCLYLEDLDVYSDASRQRNEVGIEDPKQARPGLRVVHEQV